MHQFLVMLLWFLHIPIFCAITTYHYYFPLVHVVLWLFQGMRSTTTPLRRKKEQLVTCSQAVMVLLGNQFVTYTLIVLAIYLFPETLGLDDNDGTEPTRGQSMIPKSIQCALKSMWTRIGEATQCVTKYISLRQTNYKQ